MTDSSMAPIQRFAYFQAMNRAGGKRDQASHDEATEKVREKLV